MSERDIWWIVSPLITAPWTSLYFAAQKHESLSEYAARLAFVSVFSVVLAAAVLCVRRMVGS